MAKDQASAEPPIDALIAALTAPHGNRSSVETEREPDGRMKVAVRGEVYDGRRVLKAILAGLSVNDPTGSRFDLDLDIKVAKLEGFNGEALRDVDLELSGQGGHILAFSLTAKLADDADLKGDLRQRGTRHIIYLETKNAGAFFRFVDFYPRMRRGDMWAAIDLPTPDHAPQDGAFAVRDFSLAGERALLPIIPSEREHDARQQLAFSRLRLRFKWSSGLVVVDDGIVTGHAFGATAMGNIDLTRDDISLRGVVIPLWQDPICQRRGIICDFFQSPTDPGLDGINYALTGPLQTLILKFDPVTRLAPGFLRKLFDVPSLDP